MTTAVSPTIAARVAAVLATAPTWVHGTRKSDRRQFWIVPGSTAGTTYYVDATDCSCACARLWAVKIPCKHSLAVRQYLADRPAATAQPAPDAAGQGQELARADRAAHRARLRRELGMIDEAA